MMISKYPHLRATLPKLTGNEKLIIKYPEAKPLRRSLPLAKQCVHLGERLTPDEQDQYKRELMLGKIPCRTCEKQAVPAHHCSHPIAGRFTYEVKCQNCTNWKRAAGTPYTDFEPLELPDDWHKAPDVWQTFQRMIQHEKASYKPTDAGEGNGIVIVGGGKYFAAAYCNARLIRHHGCKLPIELWYLGRNNEMPDKWQRIIEPYGVTCIDADEVRKVKPMRILNGWELKFYAVKHSSFRRLIFLDADCYPMRDPTFTLNDPRFLGSGAVFQRDCSKYEYIKPSVLEMFGLPKEQVWDLESGAFLIDKLRWGPALHLTVFLNAHSDLVYKVLYGDKTTPAIAARLAGQTYAIPPHAPSGGGWGLMQKWFDGSDLYQHRIHMKPALQPTAFTSNQLKSKNIKWSNEINGYLNDLRKQI